MDRRARATTIAGILAGLQSGGQSVFDPHASVKDGEPEELGRIVLKFTTKGLPQKGPLGSMKMLPLGENDDNQFFTMSTAEARALFHKLLHDYGTIPSGESDSPASWYELLDQVEGIELYSRADRVDPSMTALDFSTPQPVDVVLWPTSILDDRRAARAAEERVAEIEALLASATEQGLYGQVTAKDVRPDTPLVRAVVDSDVLEKLLTHPVVERVRGPLAATIAPSHLLMDCDRPDSPSPSGARIGVLDDLVVTANPWMREVVVNANTFPAGQVFGGFTPHGTSVASIAAYGSFEDVFRGGAPVEPFPILAARVAQADPSGRPTIPGGAVEAVEQALAWLHEQGARIAVLAFGYDYPDTDPLPTELTATLDRLSRELGIVIVVSSGNVREIGTDHWRDNYPSYLSSPTSKVAAPAAAALALTVGATTVRHTPHDTSLTGIAPEKQLSPFSRTGPTRGNRFGKTRKPEFAAPGGNWGWSDALNTVVMNDSNLGVATLSTKNTPMFLATSGTSIAAPYVAHEIARIATRYPDAGPNLLRALTALAGQSTADRPGRDLRGGAVGSAYGMPEAGRVLESGGNHAILVHEGEIVRGGRLIFTLPIPREFASLVPGALRRVRITLAFDPPVRRSRRDYVAGRMRFDFVRNMTLEEVKRTWEVQPSVVEAKNDGLQRDSLPGGRLRPATLPGVNAVHSNTLIRRDIEIADWNEDDETYFLVVSHDSSSWTSAQLAKYPVETFALAIELIDEGRTSLDLHSLVASELTAQTRAQSRARATR